MKSPSIAPSFVLGLVLFVMEGVFCSAQNQMHLRFRPTYAGQPVSFDTTTYRTATGARITVSMLKFYLSNLVATMSNGIAPGLSETVLLDLVDPEELLIPVESNSRVTTLSFTIGVDSLANESGPREGALDPLNGMYWTWATGYIFFKLEGTLETESVPKRVYEIHLGGYKAPYRNMFDVTLPVTYNAADSVLTIDVAIDRFFDAAPAFDIARRPSITDARQATDVTDRLRGMFRVR
ncbi:MAG: MbnP family protein [Candidatus Kapaibacterium sp.]